MLEYLYLFLSGYLTVELDGEFPERIINLCSQNNISFKNLEKTDGKIRITILAKYYKILRKLRRKSDVKISIINKNGLPFIIKKYGFRPGIPTGIAVYIIILFLLSNYIWSFNIISTNNFSKRDIIERCKKLGIYVGVNKNKIKDNDLNNQLISTSDDIAWASFNIQGSVLEINLTEINDADKQKQPSNLKANADGIIKKLNLVSGTPLVKVGDTVAKGQILVSGVLELPEKTKFVRSSGVVTAKVQRKFNYTFDEFKETKEFYSSQKHRVLEVFGLKIPLYLGRIHGKAETEYKENILKILGNEVPISLNTITFDKYFSKFEMLESNDALSYAKELLADELETLNISDAIIKDKTINYKNGKFDVKFTVICTDNIAYEDFLAINDAK